MTLAEFTSIAAITISIVSIYLAYRKAPHEEAAIDANAAETWEKAATMAGERANRLEDEIARVKDEQANARKIIREQGILIDTLVGKDSEKEERIRYLENENKSLIERVNILEAENGDLREWASRLVTQVKTLGGTPVALRGRK